MFNSIGAAPAMTRGDTAEYGSDAALPGVGSAGLTAAASAPDGGVLGWDIGGAHVKAALVQRGRVLDAMQWPCPLWQGLDRLHAVLQQARERWPALERLPHAVTMTGEMVDHFEHREDGVRRIAALLAAVLPAPSFFSGDAGWCPAAEVGERWPQVASANWLATARHTAGELDAEAGVLVDIGSTTTDLIAFRNGRVLCRGRSDAERLASSELVYHGVSRTPLCALAQRIEWGGQQLNVMNEFFATTADIYRLTSELDPVHDQHPAADNAPKDMQHSQARLARMIGLDARDGSDARWLAFARAWRTQQLNALREQLARVRLLHDLPAAGQLVAAGCGAFLVPELAPPGWSCRSYATDVAHAAGSPALNAWIQVAAPAVAVAALYARERR